MLNNPIKLIDPDGNSPCCEWLKEKGKQAAAFVAGAANSIASNAVGGAPGTRGDPSEFGNYSTAASYGQTAGDVISVVVGGVEMIASATGLVGESITAVPSGGASLTLTPATVAVGTHGALMTHSGLSNLMMNDVGSYSPDRPLPRDDNGLPKPDSEAIGTKHSQLGTKQGRKGKYNQAREFDENGKAVKDIDFTDHGRKHPNPHQHRYIPNETGGTMKRGPYEPLKIDE